MEWEWAEKLQLFLDIFLIFNKAMTRWRRCSSCYILQQSNPLLKKGAGSNKHRVAFFLVKTWRTVKAKAFQMFLSHSRVQLEMFQSKEEVHMEKNRWDPSCSCLILGMDLYCTKAPIPILFSKEHVIVVITCREAPTEVTKVWCQQSEFLEDDQLACGKSSGGCIWSLFNKSLFSNSLQ